MLDNINITSINLKTAKILKGQFTNCYIWKSKPYIILHSIDILKECMSQWLDFDNPHIPEIKRIDCQWYIMPKYKPVESNIDAYKLACEINNLQNYCGINFYPKGKRYNYDKMTDFAEVLRKKVSESIADGFLAVLESCTNGTSEFTLDLKMENFSVDNNGNLILRDILARRKDCLGNYPPVMCSRVFRKIGGVYYPSDEQNEKQWKKYYGELQ